MKKNVIFIVGCIVFELAFITIAKTIFGTVTGYQIWGKTHVVIGIGGTILYPIVNKIKQSKVKKDDE